MKKAFFLFVLTVLCPWIVLSQWSSDPLVNNPINIAAGEQAIPKITTCPNGDTYIGFYSVEGGNYNVRLQRLNSSGVEQWTTGGILVSDWPQMTWLTDWDMTADNANHAILAFQDIRNGGNNNIVAYRISPAGDFVWGADGIALSNSTAFNASPKVCATAAGNAVFAWQADDVTIMQKVSPAGTLLWGSTGITLSGTERYTWPQLMPVGSDEVILKFFKDTGPVNAPTRHVYARRYDATGSQVWGSETVISNAGGISAWTQIFPMINDGSDGFYIAWHDDRDNNMLSSSYVQHVSSTGTVLFPANGVEAGTMAGRNHFYPQLALPPGSSEVYVFWNEMSGDQNQRGINGQKLSSTGSRLWGDNGLTFIALSYTNVYPFAASFSPTDVVLFYNEYFDAVNSQIKAMRVNSSGGFVWAPSFKTICAVNSEKVHEVANNFANNQWILSWEDTRNADRDIYAQNIQLNGNLGPVQFGFITGEVTLVGGSGNITNVEVTAGDITVNPASDGTYSIYIQSGTYDVTGTLPGYYPDTVFNVAVTTNNTTPDIDLTLNAIPTGFITGNVVLNGGTGNVTSVVVTAGYQTTNPDANGDYSIEIAIGTYDVTASLSEYYPDTVTGVTVAQGQTTGDVDFELIPLPTTGFISGNVQLEGGGDITQAVVTAGNVSVNPNANGDYLIEIVPGTYDVSASMTGYLTQVVSNVVVILEQTTPDIDFYLYLMATNGYIDGYVTLVNGTGDVTQAEVTAGGQMTSPNASGFYYLTVPVGTYTVTASHPYTLPDSVTNVVVEAGVSTSNVNLELEVVRCDLICKAVDQWGGLLNEVTVEIDSPDGTLGGIITNDSLVFENVVYGDYNGIAWFNWPDTVSSTAQIGAGNVEIVFEFIIGAVSENDGEMSGLVIYPNPTSSVIYVRSKVKGQRLEIVEVFNVHGDLVKGVRGEGEMEMDINDLPAGVYYLRICIDEEVKVAKVIKMD